MSARIVRNRVRSFHVWVVTRLAVALGLQFSVGTDLQIFKDESQGIICYYDENGDLICEGWDEGPHFQPDPQQPTLRR